MLDRPLRVLFIIAVAWFVSRLLRRGVTRFAAKVAQRGIRARDQKVNPVWGNVRRLAMLDEQEKRSEQRALTLGDVLSSAVSIVIWTVAIFMILGEFGVNLAPLIASAGVAGIAIGFGAQSVVSDFLAGIFVIIEDHYGVGDFVDLGEAKGTVEEVSLRTTRLRDAGGVMWVVPNGQILRVGNYSQLFSKSRMEFEVGYDTDVDHASAVIKRVLDEVWMENREDATVTEEPEVLGVEAFRDSAVVISATVRTEPSEQWSVAREIRARIKKAFEAEGIEIPFPQRTVWLRQEQ
jgi:small conductance mechanosensitive channel